MGRLGMGLVLSTLEDPVTGTPERWEQVAERARLAERLGFDTLWVPDELLWQAPGWSGPRGWWECVAVCGALAAVTSRIRVGSWVLSALHRNPGLTVRVAETLDEISGGRFVLGLGCGHAGPQARRFGYPADRLVARFEEALAVIMPLLREGSADAEGRYHSAADLVNRPRGPQGTDLPLMLGGHGPRTMRLAVRHADIWSGFATEGSAPGHFAEMLQRLDAICEEEGRDPASLERSLGVFVEPTDERVPPEAGFGETMTGSPAQIGEALDGFRAIGVTRLELMVLPRTVEAITLAGEAVALLG